MKNPFKRDVLSGIEFPEHTTVLVINKPKYTLGEWAARFALGTIILSPVVGPLFIAGVDRGVDRGSEKVGPIIESSIDRNGQPVIENSEAARKDLKSVAEFIEAAQPWMCQNGIETESMRRHDTCEELEKSLHETETASPDPNS